MSGKKRPHSDPGEAGHAEGAQQSDRPRYSKVDQETLNYFEEISNHFDSLDDDEERCLVADNALGEASGNEARVASDAACSRVLEKFLPFVTIAALEKFTNACIEGENLGATCTSGPFGSHVLEKVVAELGKRARQADEESFGTIQQVLANMTQAISDNLYDMAVHKYATHVARRLLCVLCGRDVAPAARKQQQQRQQQLAAAGAGGGQQQQLKSSLGLGGLAAKLGAAGTAAGGEGAAGTADFPELLERVVGTVLSEGWEEAMGELRKDPFGGPLLQALLRAAVCLGSSDLHHKLTLRALGVSGPDALTADSLHALMKDRAGSHLMEVVFETAPDDLYQKISTLSFKGHLLDLTRHPAANFAVQAGIASLKKPAQLKRVFEDLRPHLASLLRSRRGGVAAALAGAAGRLETLQADVAAALWHALGAGAQVDGAGSPSPLEALLTLDTNVRLGDGGRLSALGCALASTLLHYPPTDCKPFAEALAALPPSKLSALAKDSGGCRVLEAYIEGAGASPKKRRALLQALAGSYAAAASHPAGNYFVEKCYALADLKEKELIAGELAAAEQRLATTYRGMVLLRRCNVEAIKKGSDTWQQRVAAADAVRREFEDLFAEGGGGEGQGGGTEESGDEQAGPGEGEGELEGGRPGAGTKERKKKARAKEELDRIGGKGAGTGQDVGGGKQKTPKKRKRDREGGAGAGGGAPTGRKEKKEKRKQKAEKKKKQAP